jgi:hypothetical protein
MNNASGKDAAILVQFTTQECRQEAPNKLQVRALPFQIGTGGLSFRNAVSSKISHCCGNVPE